MVKNVSGGNKSKGFARKNFAVKDTSIRVIEDEDELYAQVTKIYGGSMCQVVLRSLDLQHQPFFQTIA